MDRIVVLVDMDCFYCQVETRINPNLKGKPVAVVQYNAWKGGGIIAVNYEARDKGVTRHMRGDEAKKHCPDIELVQVPTVREKADLTKYRDAGREVIGVLCTFSECVERASVDEAYLDITAAVEQRMAVCQNITPEQLNNTFVVGYSPEGVNDEDLRQEGLNAWLEEAYSNELWDKVPQKLSVAALIVEEMRAAVYEKTGFRCSAGIAHNKILAKLSCGLHKPNRQTILPHSSVPHLYATLPVKKVRNLGGKFGNDIVDNLGCKMMSDLSKFTEKDLQAKYDDKTGSWLYNIARGIDYDPVTPRLISKSIGCCKKFPGRTALCTKDDIQHWLSKLSEELSERVLEDLTMNKRRAQLLTVSTHCAFGRKEVASSKSAPLTSYESEKIALIAFPLIRKMSNTDPNSNIWTTPVTFIGLSAGKFSGINSGNTINNFFKSTPLESEARKTLSVAESKNKENERNYVETENGGDPSGEGSFFEKFLKQNLKSDISSSKKLVLVPKLSGDVLEDSSDSRNSADEAIPDLPDRSSSSGDPTKGVSVPDAKIEPARNSFFAKHSEKNKTSRSPVKESENESKTKKESSIDVLLKKSSNWINPYEVFPDLNAVDDEIISSLPPSFRKKILEMKKEQTKSLERVDAVDRLKPSDPLLDKFKNDEDDDNSDSDCDIFESTDKSREKIDDEVCSSPQNDRSTSDTEQKQKQCVQCGILLAVSEYEEHTDRHMAEELDRQWNQPPPVVEKRNIPAGKLSHSIPNNSKRKSKSSEKKHLGEVTNKKFRSIESFFRK